MLKYSLHIVWSESDDAYLATVPEMLDICGVGETWATAAASAHTALSSKIELSGKDGLPEPFCWVHNGASDEGR